jgi:cbb3-type cytochrome oxidase maturation protein
MSALYMLIPISVAVAAGFVVVCLIAIRSGQFDDLESPRWRVLFDEKNAASLKIQDLLPSKDIHTVEKTPL